jgi:hypothetical protein
MPENEEDNQHDQSYDKYLHRIWAHKVVLRCAVSEYDL